ncbi:MAG: type II toxin-antitoxin system VapC family toxin [Pseudomonadota bacterium]
MADQPRTLWLAEPAAAYLVQAPLVVDCSLMAALLFDEAERDVAHERLVGRRLFAPRLLDYEMANVSLKKLHRGMAMPDVEQALDDFQGLDIELLDAPLQALLPLARRYGLSAYDAAYLWLAAALKAPLATFDAKLGEAARVHLAAL